MNWSSAVILGVVKMAKSVGIVVAKIHVFKDGDYAYTGDTFVVNEGPDEWIWSASDYDAVIKSAHTKWGEFEGFEVFGLNNYIHLI
jgi:hypothetical protein